MPTALLAGAFGQRNPGDEALLDAFTQALPDWDVIATAAVPPHGRDTETVPSDDPARVARAMTRADAVVFAGGTVFKELSPRTRRPRLDLLQKGAALAYGAKALGKRLVMVGVGAALHLQQRGHDVRWYAGPSYRPKLDDLGIPCFTFQRAREVNGENIEEPMEELEEGRENGAIPDERDRPEATEAAEET